MLVPVTLHQRSPLAAQLGAELSSEVTPLHADAIVANPMQTGLAAAGDAAGMMPSVANAVAAGSNAASMIVGSLVLGRALDFALDSAINDGGSVGERQRQDDGSGAGGDRLRR